MTTFLRDGQMGWEGERDADGHRTYKLRSIVICDSSDGPFNVLNTPGLPLPGSEWAFDGDADPWAFCTAEATIKPALDGEPNEQFVVEQTFTTKPQTWRCQDVAIEDPLLEPPRLSGNFTRYTEEAAYDRFGEPITNSAHEQYRGPQVEFDRNRIQVVIEMNVPELDLDLLSSMVDTVNEDTLWGMPPRCIKLSDAPWERKFYGQCYVYFTVRLVFDVRRDTFDRDLLDEGAKVLSGRWDNSTNNWVDVDIPGYGPPNPSNPQHFIRFTDRQGNACRVILDGSGRPAGVSLGSGSSTATATNDFFVCVVAETEGGATPDAPSWLRLRGGPGPAPAWSPSEGYAPGDLVTFDPSIWKGLEPSDPLGEGSKAVYVADQFHFPPAGTAPAEESMFPDAGVGWVKLTTGLHDKGIYASIKVYKLGDYVRDQPQHSEAGSVHVEKYDESDFLLLGIPTEL